MTKNDSLHDPNCPDCHGDGHYSICWNNNPDREEEVACSCEPPTCVYCGEPLTLDAPEKPYCSSLCAVSAENER